ncbi:heme-binding protein [uncultured Kordia sp.]|uniref:heme-binding protein n=1 Tax=uncultured Kordia sp. TaxID=507699 RepID=UPI0026261759|nr:heme-binding protein [uncultured Kordia sp.]
MIKKTLFTHIKNSGRTLAIAKSGDEALGPLKHLPGTWKNTEALNGRGWNMIAVPFADGKFGYRLLLNQYNETLVFKTVDKGVPNRGIPTNTDGTDGDQFLVALDYSQTIEQIIADDFPKSGLAGKPKLKIHHEPGLWLHMLNKTTNKLDIARLATVPHGDSVLALGRSDSKTGKPIIPKISGLPIGLKNPTLSNKYLEPYKHFKDNLFQGVFNPVSPNDLLVEANKGVNIRKTTILDVDSKIETGGVINIPFITKQANATEMTSTFWIQELRELDDNGKPKLRLQYTQTVFLDFFKRTDGVPGLIRWPHVSINTLEKVSD